MRVYVYLVDGLYRRAELNKHPHCVRLPARARPQQRCPAVSLPALAVDCSREVNWIRWERARARIHVHLSIHAYIHTYTNVAYVCRCIKKNMCVNTDEHICMYIFEAMCSYINQYTRKLYVAKSINTRTSPVCRYIKKIIGIVQPSKRLSTALTEPEQRLHSASIAT